MKKIIVDLTNKISASLSSYQCKKCGTLVQKDRNPNTSGCPKGGSHSWYKL